MNKFLLLFCCYCFLCTSTQAQSKKAVETSTDILMFVNPVAGFVATLLNKDYSGTKQIVIGGASSLAATYLLKYSIKKERPDKSNHHSFPSAHTSVAMQGAAFIQRRYGWKFGAPAYALSVYIGWGRIYAKKHDIWDVLGGAAIGTASSYLFTRPFAQKHKLTLAPVLFNGEHPGINFSLSF